MNKRQKKKHSKGSIKTVLKKALEALCNSDKDVELIGLRKFFDNKDLFKTRVPGSNHIAIICPPEDKK